MPQLATALKNQPKRGAAPIPQTPEEIAAAARERAAGAQMEAAYKALNAKHIEEAEGRFKEILANRTEQRSRARRHGLRPNAAV